MVSGDSKVVSEDFIEISTFILLNQFKVITRKIPKLWQFYTKYGLNLLIHDDSEK